MNNSSVIVALFLSIALITSSLIVSSAIKSFGHSIEVAAPSFQRSPAQPPNIPSSISLELRIPSLPQISTSNSNYNKQQ